APEMQEQKNEPVYHLSDPAWRFTSNQAPRGYIQPEKLDELWFHTGTRCNLRCPFCFEGSSPQANRVQELNLEDVKPIIDEALTLGVERFSFTGGEPMVVEQIIEILNYALSFKPCLVLTNATLPLLKLMDKLAALTEKNHPLRFR
ncbi:MAG: radical SAM protein, partial [Planctomycetes bacterium]|nr:radical SAM protein [Planctomycetota bacterium]